MSENTNTNRIGESGSITKNSFLNKRKIPKA